MNKIIRILHVEDNSDDRGIAVDSIDQFKTENLGYEIELIQVQSLSDYIDLKLAFDGAIVDLKLNDDDDGGKKYIEELNSLGVRVPVAIYTGTPSNIDAGDSIRIFTKGEHTFLNVFAYLKEVYDTGVTEILRGKGLIDSKIYSVFSDVIMKKISSWIEYAKESPEETKNSILRLTLNHLFNDLNSSGAHFFPEEVYLQCSKDCEVRNGLICEWNEDRYVVITPACDLEQKKTEQIQLVMIEKSDVVNEREASTDSKGKNRPEKQKLEVIGDLKKNKKGDQYHFLPQAHLFDSGGYINFRKVHFIEHAQLNESLKAIAQISPHFMRNIIARFSSYYARQGQPEIKHI